jgi:hypothetical protein
MMFDVDYSDMMSPYEEVVVVILENSGNDNIVEIDLNMMMVFDHNNSVHHPIFVMMENHEHNFHYYVHALIDFPLNVKMFVDLYEILEFYYEQSMNMRFISLTRKKEY